MRATRRFWTTASVGILFSLLAVGGARPVALVGTVGAGTWLVATAWTAAHTFQQLDEGVTVEYTVETPTAQVGSTATATLTVTRPTKIAETPFVVSLALPPGIQFATETPQTIRLEPGETTATTVVTMETSVAGEFELPVPTLELVDPLALYTETIRRPVDPQLTVLPPEPTVHVGKGGEAYGNAFGEHPTDRPGPGIAVRELRQYLAGEDAMNIDWKSTARLGEPYVRETEGETDRHTALIVDHRAETAQAAGTEPPLEYIREAALALTTGASAAGDPVSLRTVGDEGITDAVPPGGDPSTYSRVQSALLHLKPTTTGPDRSWAAQTHRNTLDELPDDSRMAQTLQSYVTPTHRPIADEPFVTAVKQTRNEFGTGAWFVLITTDEDPVQLQESVTAATAGGATVLVLIVPTVLFDNDQVGSIADAYDAYTVFEEFRKSLDAHPRVTALELAPGDRLQTVLSQKRNTRSASQAN